MEIMFTCGREPEYPRNALIKSILEDQYKVTSLTDSSKDYWKRLLQIYPRLIFQQNKSFDLNYVGFLGQPIAPLVKAFFKGPILLDAYLSIFDTLCFDRKKFDPKSIPGRLAFWLDKYACQISDHILLDTQAHIDFFVDTFHIPKEKFSSILVGCNDALFYPREDLNHEFIVLFYGSFLPLHGVDIIIRAAKILEKETNIKFKIIGRGIESSKIEHLVEELGGGKNIDFLPPVPLIVLPDHISQASICLGGHFGSSKKASRVIAGKTFQCIAMGKSTIVGDNPANRELLTHGFDAWFCKMNDPAALVESILVLSHDSSLRRYLGNNARMTFLQSASTPVIAQKLIQIVEKILAG